MCFTTDYADSSDLEASPSALAQGRDGPPVRLCAILLRSERHPEQRFPRIVLTHSNPEQITSSVRGDRILRFFTHSEKNLIMQRFPPKHSQTALC